MHEASRPLIDIDLSACHTKKQTLIQLGTALKLPSYYGANFDALADCLADQYWRKKNGLVIKLSGMTGLSRHDAQTYATLIEIFNEACLSPTLNNMPLWFLVDCIAPTDNQSANT